MFADREEELGFLERKWSERGAQLVVIYGRRRVGKTMLLKEFLKGKIQKGSSPTFHWPVLLP